jgi:hypothetical protein
MPQPSHPLSALRRTGVVTGVANVPITVQVGLGGDVANPQEIPYIIDAYTPVVGDTVLIISVDGDHIVIGGTSGTSVGALNADPWHYLNLTSGQWIDYDPTEGTWTATKYRKVNGVVYFVGLVAPNVSLPAGSTSTITTLPTGYRPLHAFVISSYRTDASTSIHDVRVTIDDSGVVTMLNEDAVTAGVGSVGWYQSWLAEQ